MSPATDKSTARSTTSSATINAVTIKGLRIEVASNGHDIVDEVNLAIAPGEVLGLVGESGSGKTTVGLSVLGHARRGVVGRAGSHQRRRPQRGRPGSAGTVVRAH